MIDPDVIQQIFDLIDRPIWIVTAAAGGRRGGLVATWISQTSLEPARPVVMAAIAPNHFTGQLIDRSGVFVLHMISHDQIDAAWNFAIGSGRDRDKIEGYCHESTESGSPILTDCLCWLDCRVFAKITGGDRNYYWADVIAAGQLGHDPPLTERALVAAASPDQKTALRKDLQSDIAHHRPLYQQWRENLPENLRFLASQTSGDSSWANGGRDV